MNAFASLCSPGRSRIATEAVGAFARVLRVEFGVPFRTHDGSTGELLTDPDPAGCEPSTMGDSAIEVLAHEGGPRVSAVGGDCYRIVLPIAQGGAAPLIAIGYLPAFARSPMDLWQETERLQKWVEAFAELLARGADVQWDGRVIAAYFRARDRIHAIHQRGVGESVCVAIENAFR